MSMSLSITILIGAMTTIALTFALVWLRALGTAMTHAEALAINPLPVERNEYGHWTHPAWPHAHDEECIPKTWFADNGLETFIVDFEGDAPEDLATAYYEQGNPDCSAWQPSTPPGPGWFVFSIHDTEEGPVCVWVRPVLEGTAHAAI